MTHRPSAARYTFSSPKAQCQHTGPPVLGGRGLPPKAIRATGDSRSAGIAGPDQGPRAHLLQPPRPTPAAGAGPRWAQQKKGSLALLDAREALSERLAATSTPRCLICYASVRRTSHLLPRKSLGCPQCHRPAPQTSESLLCLKSGHPKSTARDHSQALACKTNRVALSLHGPVGEAPVPRGALHLSLYERRSARSRSPRTPRALSNSTAQGLWCWLGGPALPADVEPRSRPPVQRPIRQHRERPGLSEVGHHHLFVDGTLLRLDELASGGPGSPIPR